MDIAAGGSGSEITVAASCNISVGGNVQGITVDGNGGVQVISGGTATDINIKTGSLRMDVAPDTYAQGKYLNSDFENSNGFLSGFYAASGASICVFESGKVQDMLVCSGGSLYVSSGGEASIKFSPWSGTIASASGACIYYEERDANVYWMNPQTGLFSSSCVSDLDLTGYQIAVYASGMMKNITVGGSGSAKIFNDGAADGTMLQSGGILRVSSGGTANKTAVSSGGLMYVSCNGTAADTTVSSGGEVTVCYGGTANGITLSCGALHVYDGGTALSIKENGGYVSLAANAHVTFVSNNFSGVCIDCNDSATLHSGTTANSTTIFGKMEIFSGGTASDTVINVCGKMNVFAGGTADGTTVNSSGNVNVFAGGTAVGTIVNSSGFMGVSSGGTANGITLSGGRMLTWEGGTASDITISSGGRCDNQGTVSDVTVNCGGKMYIQGSGSALNIVENGGFVSVYSGADVTFVSNTFSGVQFGPGDSVTLHSGTTANDTRLNSGAQLYVFSGGTANNTDVNRSGGIEVFSGGTVNSTTLNSGYITVCGGTANGVTVNCGGMMYVQEGSTLNIVENGGFVSVGSGADVTFVSHSFNGLRFEWWDSATLHSGTTANSTTVRGNMFICGGIANDTAICYSGRMDVSSGGVANNTVIDNYDCRLFIENGGIANNTILSGGRLFIENGGIANNTILSGGLLCIENGGIANNTILSGGSLYLYSGGCHTGRLWVGNQTVFACEGATIDFTLTDSAAEKQPLIKNLSGISGAPDYTITVGTNQAHGIYSLAEGAASFDKTVTVQTSSGEKLGTVSLTQVLSTEYADYTLNETDDLLTLTVFVHSRVPTELSGNESGLSWKADVPCKVLYSRSGSANGIQLVTSGRAVDTYGVPAGTYDWKIAPEDSSEWVKGNTFTAAGHTVPTVLKSDKDGKGDIFFAGASTVWNSGYAAEHQGILGGWSGTGEQIDLAGKNQITDVFEGSTDANILVMTDDANGDALFVDDIYSAFPEEQQARIAQINEIRAGQGDDVVDMTSQRFAYTGDGLIIRGGAGDDTIWANAGDNKLFGDAGNDRIVGASGNDVIVGGAGDDSLHGGGGNDIFCFCQGWGRDTVEQLTGGSVTLWFADNSGSWDQSTMTYTQGDNSVKVSGVTNVTLKFGDDGSELYATLAAVGCFMSETSEKIWEEEGRGIIASL